MTNPQRATLALTTSAGGAASGTVRLTGYVHAVRVTGFDGSADVTVASPSQTILIKTSIDAEETFYPRSPVHQAADGAAITGGYSPILLIDDVVTVTIAGGGNATSGLVTIDVVPAG